MSFLGIGNGCGGWLGVRSSDVSASYLHELLTNAAGSNLAVGEVVRISADSAITRSQADSAANAQGTVGVAGMPIANGGIGPVVTEGQSVVLLEAGLVGVAAGQTLWVSPTTPGRATNVKPSGVGEVELCVGIIKNASGYAGNNTVVADVDPDCEPKIAGLVASIQCGSVAFNNETTKAVPFPVAFGVGVQPAVVLTPIDPVEARPLSATQPVSVTISRRRDMRSAHQLRRVGTDVVDGAGELPGFRREGQR